jgi:hypothetical protein
MPQQAPGYFNNNVPATPYGGAGSNQYFGSSYGTMPGNTAAPSGGGGYYNDQSPSAPMTFNPYQAPQQGNSATYDTNPTNNSLLARKLGSGVIATPQQYPWLGNDFATYLASQIGQGVQPFNLSTVLPTGGMTQPGQLSAPLNPLLQQLQQFFQTGVGSGMPGADALGTIASQGISALPEWQSMIAAQQQNIGQNEAQLREQFAGLGDLAGSPFGTAESNFRQQTTLDQNALLAQLQQQNILQGQIPVAQFLNQGATQMAGGLQNLNQQAIQQYLQQFQLDQPQNNPMNTFIANYGALFPPTNQRPSTWQNINSTIGALTGSGYSSSATPGGGQSSQIMF